jgi:Helicase HerA, central domain
MPFIEAPTSFYLGRRYEPAQHKLTQDIVYYDSRDLTTHAVVVGMTGSGKTGLCISLLEEAVLDDIPAIVIDPKGDITNLLLNFPDFRAEDFEPWVNIDDARRARMEVPAFAADIAHRWREGLESWGIVPDRVRWLKHAARYSIYTPGSDAGLPVSILASFKAPRDGWVGNEEALLERINGITTALLALTGRDAQPVQDKEHVLVSNIFQAAWQQGRDLTLEDIILQVQKPPFNKLGVFNLDEYISEKARQKLALDLNSIVAAPSFQTWINGDPMDIQGLLYQPNGRPRVSVFYIAHLTESERQFVITLLLENMLGWMRMQSGTTSLRCLLYIDEMFGYFPPFPRNPPTKEPILRLLKQARGSSGVCKATRIKSA